MGRRQPTRSASGAGRTCVASVVCGLAALALSLGGAVIAGVAGTSASAGAANASPSLYVLDYGANVIDLFPTSASGDVAPTASATGSSLNQPSGEVLDSRGDLWVANWGGGTGDIAEFAPGQVAAGGSPTPAVLITGVGASALAFDTAGDLWATTFAGPVLEFTPDQLASSGSPAPAVTLSGLSGSWGLSFDASGDLWVGNYDDAVVEYAPDQLAASGSPTPGVTLMIGSGFPPPSPAFPTFDSKGDLWVSLAGIGDVDEFIPGQLTSSGSPTPAVSLTGFNVPNGLTFDTAGDLWVADFGAPAVDELTPGQLTSSGSPTPARSITGSNTGFVNPSDVAIAEPPVVTSLSPSAGGSGTAVTIHGAGFDNASTVAFGSASAQSVRYVSPYELDAVAPSGSGAVDVTVSTFAGTSATSSADQFTYTSGGYWEVASDGGIFAFNAPYAGSMGGRHLNAPIVGMAASRERHGLLGSGLRRRHLRLQRAVRRLHGWPTPQRSDRCHGRRPGDRRLLGGCLRRRHLRLRCAVLRVDGRETPERAHRRHGRGPRRGRVLARGQGRRRLQLRRRGDLRRIPGGQGSERPRGGDGGQLGRQGLLGGGLRRRHLLLRCRLRGVPRWPAARGAGGRDGCLPGRIGLLGGGLRRRHLLLRSPLRRLHGRQAPRRARGRNRRALILAPPGDDRARRGRGDPFPGEHHHPGWA